MPILEQSFELVRIRRLTLNISPVKKDTTIAERFD